jgi:hypothetical protein
LGARVVIIETWYYIGVITRWWPGHRCRSGAGFYTIFVGFQRFKAAFQEVESIEDDIEIAYQLPAALAFVSGS